MKGLYEGMMGLLVADALGVPFEFKKRDSFTVTDLVGGGTHGQPVGSWSDDGALALATLYSLGQRGGVDLCHMMNAFCDWYYKGAFCSHGQVFDVGITTRNAIAAFKKEGDPRKCGAYGEWDNGNGSLMRILPLAFLDVTDGQVAEVSALTHGHKRSVTGCLHYLTVARALLKGADKRQALALLEGQCEGAYARLPHIDCLSREQIKSSGYVVDTLEGALWCFMTTDCYRDCVIRAVELGEDTETVAAVAGGLAGIYYGVGKERGIPEKWIAQIPKKEWIKELCSELEAL